MYFFGKRKRNFSLIKNERHYERFNFEVVAGWVIYLLVMLAFYGVLFYPS